MIGLVSFYDSEKHALISGGEIGPYIEKLGKEAHRDLFVVRYNLLQTYVICEWVSPNHDVFFDVLNLGKSLGNFTRVKANELQRRLFAPLSAEAESRGIADNESDYFHRRQDENEAEGERLAKCARGE